MDFLNDENDLVFRRDTAVSSGIGSVISREMRGAGDVSCFGGFRPEWIESLVGTCGGAPSVRERT